MRTYYIFHVKEEFVKLYQERPSSLYAIFKQLFFLNKKDLNYGIQVFSSIAEKIQKQELNKQIYIKYHKDMIYTKTDTEHIINNLYKDEISILTIKNSHLLLTTNHSYSSFFNILIDFNSHFFVCDFQNQDYFFLNDVKILV